MIRRYILILIGMVLNGSVSFAQGSDFGQRDYQNGKDLFSLERYELAIEAFQPLISGSIASPFRTYASFYYALSAYRLGQLARARDMLLQIANRAPGWNNIDEVYFWLGQIYFEQSEPGWALAHLYKIGSPVILETATAMRLYYLKQLEDSILEELYQEYPDDRELASVFARRLSSFSESRQDQERLRDIVEKHDLDPKEFEVIAPSQSIKKDQYNIAVLFPFQYEEKLSRPYQRTNLVLDLYEGIQWAVEQLGREGINIRLYAYDTKRDAEETANILKHEEIRLMDLLIGPLLPNSNKLVSEYSKANRINMVNPISDNSAVIGDNPFSFLSTSSSETRALEAAELTRNRFYPNKNAMIFYGSSEKDSVLAFTYRRAIEEDSFRVVWMPRLAEGTSHVILDSLAAHTVYRVEDIEHDEPMDSVAWHIRPDSIGHIFVASYDDQIAANAISAVESRPDPIPTIGHSEWLDFNFIEYEQLERLNMYFLAANFIDPSKAVTQDLKWAYLKRVHRKPSKYFYIGYDVMMFWGQMLNEYGTYFQVGLGEMDIVPGRLSNGYQYGYSNDNQHVSIYRFEEARLVLVDGSLKVQYPQPEAEEIDPDRDGQGPE